MTNQDDEEKRNMRIMWIASGVVVLFIVGLMSSQYARHARQPRH